MWPFQVLAPCSATIEIHAHAPGRPAVALVRIVQILPACRQAHLVLFSEHVVEAASIHQYTHATKMLLLMCVLKVAAHSLKG